MRIKFLSIVLLFFISISFMQSQSLKISSDTNNVMIGDLIELNIQYLSSDSTSLQLPVFDVSLIDGIELLSESDLDTVKNGTTFGLSKRYTVSAYDSGSYVIPRQYLLSDSSALDTIYSDSLVLRFNSPAVDTTQAIKDIKGIYNIDYKDYSLLYYILAIVLLFVVGAILFMYFRKRKDKKEDKVIEYDPKIPPYILAKESLRRLEEERLWQNGYFKKYYSDLTDILRIYYHRIYDIKTKELTSHELIDVLEHQSLFDSECKSKLEYISQYSDLSKFAKANPLPENNNQSLKFAFDLVEVGKPLSDKKGGENVQ